MTQTMSVSSARQQWSQLVNKVFQGNTEVLVEKSGIPVAAIVSAQDYRILQRVKKQREEDFAILDKIRAAFKDQTPEQIQAAVTDAIAQVRKENKKRPR